MVIMVIMVNNYYITHIILLYYIGDELKKKAVADKNKKSGINPNGTLTEESAGKKN